MHIDKTMIMQVIAWGFLFRLGWCLCDVVISEFQNGLVHLQTWLTRKRG